MEKLMIDEYIKGSSEVVSAPVSKERFSVHFPGPYEIVDRIGEHALTDAQLLAVILRTGTEKKDATGLACEILSACDPDRGLSGLNRLTMSELTGIDGIGKVKAAQLRCVCEIARRMGRRRDIKKTDLSCSETIAEHYMQDMAHLERERVIAVLLDSRCRFIRDITISVGSADFAFINPRDIFCEVLKAGAAAFVLMHNHPGGDPSPSVPDVTMTKKLAEGAGLLGIRFLDHIIIGFNCFVSMRNEGVIL